MTYTVITLQHVIFHFLFPLIVQLASKAIFTRTFVRHNVGLWRDLFLAEEMEGVNNGGDEDDP
jgi:hypothetical protein